MKDELQSINVMCKVEAWLILLRGIEPIFLEKNAEVNLQQLQKFSCLEYVPYLNILFQHS